MESRFRTLRKCWVSCFKWSRCFWWKWCSISEQIRSFVAARMCSLQGILFNDAYLWWFTSRMPQWCFIVVIFSKVLQEAVWISSEDVHICLNKVRVPYVQWVWLTGQRRRMGCICLGQCMEDFELFWFIRQIDIQFFALPLFRSGPVWFFVG